MSSQHAAEKGRVKRHVVGAYIKFTL